MPLEGGVGKREGGDEAPVAAPDLESMLDGIASRLGFEVEGALAKAAEGARARDAGREAADGLR